MENVIYVKGLTKIYNKYNENQKLAIDNIHLEIKKGDFVSIMGPSGSGKTTLLNILSTIESYDMGNIQILDIDINLATEKEKAKLREESIGYIFQNYNLLDSLTIKENICFSNNLNKKKVDEDYLNQILNQLNITNIANKYPFECSGGEQQRVAIARVMMQQPSIIFADEPTGNLDSNNSNEIMNYLTKLNKNSVTIIMVTHDCKMASFANRVFYIADGKINKVINKDKKSQDEFYKLIVNENTDL